MSKESELEENRKKIDLLMEQSAERRGYFQGIKDAGRGIFWLCSAFWGFVSLMTSLFAGYAYHNIPFVKAVVDALNKGAS